MRRRPSTIQLLLAANVAALGALAVVELSAPATAQGVRPRINYTAVAGSIMGTDNQAIYIVDETTQEVAAVQWDTQTRQLKGLGFRNLSSDSADVSRPRSN